MPKTTITQANAELEQHGIEIHNCNSKRYPGMNYVVRRRLAPPSMEVRDGKRWNGCEDLSRHATIGEAIDAARDAATQPRESSKFGAACLPLV